MRYKVGDMVKIKPFDTIKGLMMINKGPGWNPNMTPMCGKVYEIIEVSHFNYYRICNERGTVRNFLEEWLEVPILLFI